MHKIKKLIKKTSLKNLKHRHSNDSTVSIHFKLQKSTQDSDEIIKICGSLPELGEGVLERAPEMQKSENGVWTYDMIVTSSTLESKKKELANMFEGNPHGYYFTYNYVISSNGTSKYEEIPKRGLTKQQLMEESNLENGSTAFRPKVELDNEWGRNPEILVKSPEIPIPLPEETDRLKGKEVRENNPSPSLQRRQSMNFIAISPRVTQQDETDSIKVEKRSRSWSDENDSNNQGFKEQAKDKMFDWYYTITGKEVDPEKQNKKEQKKQLRRSVILLKEEQKQKEKEQRLKEKEIRRANKRGSSVFIDGANPTGISAITSGTSGFYETNLLNEPEHINGVVRRTDLFNENVENKPELIQQEIIEPSEASFLNQVLNQDQSQIQVLNQDQNKVQSQEEDVPKNVFGEELEIREIPLIKPKRQRSKEEIMDEELSCAKRRNEELQRIFKRQVEERNSYDNLRYSNGTIPILQLSPKAEQKESHLEPDVVDYKVKDPITPNSDVSVENSNIIQSEIPIITSSPASTPISLGENEKNIFQLEQQSIQNLKEIEMKRSNSGFQLADNTNFNVESKNASNSLPIKEISVPSQVQENERSVEVQNESPSVKKSISAPITPIMEKLNSEPTQLNVTEMYAYTKLDEDESQLEVQEKYLKSPLNASREEELLAESEPLLNNETFVESEPHLESIKDDILRMESEPLIPSQEIQSRDEVIIRSEQIKEVEIKKEEIKKVEIRNEVSKEECLKPSKIRRNPKVWGFQKIQLEKEKNQFMDKLKSIQTSLNQVNVSEKTIENIDHAYKIGFLISFMMIFWIVLSHLFFPESFLMETTGISNGNQISIVNTENSQIMKTEL